MYAFTIYKYGVANCLAWMGEARDTISISICVHTSCLPFLVTRPTNEKKRQDRLCRIYQYHIDLNNVETIRTVFDERRRLYSSSIGITQRTAAWCFMAVSTCLCLCLLIWICGFSLNEQFSGSQQQARTCRPNAEHFCFNEHSLNSFGEGWRYCVRGGEAHRQVGKTYKPLGKALESCSLRSVGLFLQRLE